MKRILLPAVLGLGMLCAVCGVGAWGLWALTNNQNGLSIYGTPIYPGAANVAVQDLSNFAATFSSSTSFIGSSSSGTPVGSISSGSGSFIGLGAPNGEGGVITFNTNDSPQQVATFYDASLTRAGWTSMGSQASVPSSSTSSSIISSSIDHTYMYRSPFPWLPFVHTFGAFLVLHVESYFGTANSATIFLMQGP